MTEENKNMTEDKKKLIEECGLNTLEGERKKRLNLYFGISKWSTEESYMHTLNQYAVAEWKHRKRFMFVPDEGKKVNKAIFLLIVLLLLYIRKLKNRNYNQTFMINTFQERIEWRFDLMLNKLHNLYDQMKQSEIGTQRSNLEKVHEDYSALLLKNHITQEKNFCNNYFKNEIKCLENSFSNKINKEAMLDSKSNNSSFFDTYFKCFYTDKEVLKDAYEVNEKEYIFGKCKMYFKSLEKKKISNITKGMDKEEFIKDFSYLKRESNAAVIKKISKLIETDSELKFIGYLVKIFDQIYIFFYELLFFNINFFFLFNIIFCLVILYKFFILKINAFTKERTKLVYKKNNNERSI